MKEALYTYTPEMPIAEPPKGRDDKDRYVVNSLVLAQHARVREDVLKLLDAQIRRKHLKH